MSINTKDSMGLQKGPPRPPFPVKASNADAGLDQSTINRGTLVRGILKNKNSNISNTQQSSKELENDKDHCVSRNGLKTLKDLQSISNNNTDNLLKTNKRSHKDIRQLSNQYISDDTTNRGPERTNSYFDKAL
jgi:hypothetical protein